MADHLESIVVGVLEPSKDLGGFESLGGPNFNGGALDPCAYPVTVSGHIPMALGLIDATKEIILQN